MAPAADKIGPPPPELKDFGYLSIPSQDGKIFHSQETFKDKFLRKTKENPFVPVGLGVTTFALTYGLWQMKTGDRVMSQKMMRLRVAAQAFTVCALLGGVLYTATTAKKSS